MAVDRSISIHTTVAIPACSQGQLVTDRVASRANTRQLTEHGPREKNDLLEKAQYRHFLVNNIRSACTNKTDFKNYLDKFLGLAATLENSCAVLFPDHLDVDNKLAPVNQNAIQNSSQECAVTNLCLGRHQEILERIANEDNILNPLIIALLAYHMGGPINAGNSVHSHDWKNEGGAAQLPYMEGDTGDIMDDYRLTFVWEQRGAATMKPSGDHHIFLSGDTMPRSLSVIGSTSDDKTGDGIAMIYSPKNVALYYECENTSATRSSISLDFHVGGIRNEDFEVFGISPPPTDTELETGTLGRLITNFPVHDYASHFHSLLFSPTSLNTILTALDTIRLPPLPPPLIIRTAALKTRYDAYQKDNIAHVPPSLSTARETPLLWNFVSVVAFQHRLCLEMQFDLHRPLGTDLFPRSWADQHRECARTWMRGLPFEDINKHLTPYMSRLSQSPVTKESILSTRVLRWFAGYIERRCLELMSRGLENGNELLYSISALARAIGDAVDGAKEVDVVLEPWIDDTDLWIYRARCAYLFWCAEWAAGIMMLVKMNDNVDAEDSASVVEEKERREMRGVAVSLLGNWMAWAFVVEGLPARPFRVRKPVLGSEVVK